MEASDKFEALMCAILRGDRSSSPAVIGDATRFLGDSDYHGVQALLYHQLKGKEWPTALPPEFYETLRQRALLATAVETLRQRELRIVLDNVSDFAPVLVMKGSAVAFTHYPFPALRARSDTDLLIRRADFPRVETCLRQMGYSVRNAIGGELLTSEQAFRRHDRQGLAHCLDLHWRINNSQRFATAFTFDELQAESIAIPQLGEHARGLGNIHALILACIHRIRHMYAPYFVNGTPRYGGNRLIWLYDMHLLGETMTPEESARLVDLAREKKLSGICADGLLRAKDRFDSSFPSGMIANLSRNGAREPMQLPRENPVQLFGILWEFRALGSWRERFLLAKEYCFPAPDYMCAKYQSDRRYLLPFFYGHRAVHGFCRLLRGGRRRT